MLFGPVRKLLHRGAKGKLVLTQAVEKVGDQFGVRHGGSPCFEEAQHQRVENCLGVVRGMRLPKRHLVTLQLRGSIGQPDAAGGQAGRTLGRDGEALCEIQPYTG